MCRRSLTFHRAASRPFPTASTAWSTNRPQSPAPGAARPRSARWTTSAAALPPSSRAPGQAVRESLQRLASVDEPRRREHQRDADPDSGSEDRVDHSMPALPLVVRAHRGEHDEHADGHLPRRGPRQPQHQFGHSEGNGDEQRDGDAVELEPRLIANAARTPRPRPHCVRSPIEPTLEPRPERPRWRRAMRARGRRLPSPGRRSTTPLPRQAPT